MKKKRLILVSDNDTKVNYLKSLTKENIELIDAKLKENTEPKTIELLNVFKEKLSKMDNVNHLNLDESIISCLDLSETLK